MKTKNNLVAGSRNKAQISSQPANCSFNADEMFPVVLNGDGKYVTKLFNDLLTNAFQFVDSNPIAWSVCCERQKDNKLKISSNIPVIFFNVNRENGQKKPAVDTFAHTPGKTSVSISRKRSDSRILAELQNRRRDGNDGNFHRTVMQNVILNAMTDLFERRSGMAKHITNTQRCLEILYDEIKKQDIYYEELRDFNMEYLLYSARLHDIGKIGISDLIVNKPGKLTNEEYEIMKTHVEIGVEAIKKIQSAVGKNDKMFLDYAGKIVATHHEKWDGTGYPLGLRENEIPLEGRLMAIADVYDALVSKRVYKPPLNPKAACEIIKSGSGTHFDPRLVEIFAKAEGRLM